MWYVFCAVIGFCSGLSVIKAYEICHEKFGEEYEIDEFKKSLRIKKQRNEIMSLICNAVVSKDDWKWYIKDKEILATRVHDLEIKLRDTYKFNHDKKTLEKVEEK